MNGQIWRMLARMKQENHNEGPHLLLADVLALVRQEQKGQARQSLQEILSRSEMPEARFLLARLLLDSKKDDFARRQLVTACNDSIPFIDAQMLSAKLCAKEPKQSALCLHGCFEGALTLLQTQIDELDKLLPEDKNNVAEIFMGHLNKELAQMKSFHSIIGELLLRLGDCDAAYPHLLKALVCTPGAGDVRFRLAQAATTSHPEVARPLLNETILAQAIPEEVRLRAKELLEALPAESKAKSARSEILNACSVDDENELSELATKENDSHIHFLLALTQLKNKNIEGAKENFLKATSADPDFINPALLLVGLWQQAGDKKKSYQPFLKAAKASLRSMQSVWLKANPLAEVNPTLICSVVKELLTSINELQNIHDTTGYLLMKVEESDRAFPHFLRALCANPKSLRAHLGLARASAYSWHHLLAAHLSRQTLTEASFASPQAHIHALNTLFHLPGDEKSFELCRKLQDTAEHADVKFLARKVYHQWRDDFEKGTKDKSEAKSGTLDLEKSQQIMKGGETQDKLALSFQILKSKDKRALPMLLSSIKDEQDPFVLSAYAKALGAIGDGSDVVWSTLQALLKHADSRVRANTIEALDKVEDDLVWPILVPMLQDPDNRVKANTIRSLLKRSVEGARELVAKLAYSSKQSRRKSALFCLDRASAPWCDEILRQMVDKESVDELVSEECRQLAMIGSKESIGVLAALADQSPPSRQETIENALSALCKRHAVSDEQCEEYKLAHLAQARPMAAEAVADLSVSRWEVEVEPNNAVESSSPRLPLLLGATGLLVLVVIIALAMQRTPTPKVIQSKSTVKQTYIIDTVARVVAVKKDKGRIVAAHGNAYYVLIVADMDKTPSLKRGEPIRFIGKKTGRKIGVSQEIICGRLLALKSR